MFRIVVTEIKNNDTAIEAEVKRYEQTVDELDLRAVVNAVMSKKRGPRAAKKEVK